MPKEDVRGQIIGPGQIVPSAPNPPAPGTKRRGRGRPRTIVLDRQQISMWVVKSKWTALSQIAKETGVSLTLLIDHAINRILAEDEQKRERERKRQAKAKRRRKGT